MSRERPAKVYCFTPAMYDGWTYEAVNYDPAADDELPWVDARDAREAADVTDAYDVDCGDLRGTAGDDIVTPDGVRVAAWYIPAADPQVGPQGPTIVIAHGNPANKSDGLRYAQYLHEDFNLLLPDLRNSGRSSGTASTTGVLEYQEITAAIDWLVENKRPTHVGALGDSGGAAAILHAAAHGEDRIEAFVTDSVHARHSEAVGHFMSTTANPAHPRYPGLWAIELGYWIRTGHAFDEADPVDTVAAIGDRPYLLIHGTADDFDHPEVSADLIEQAAIDAGVPITRRDCEGGTHGQTTNDCGGQYGDWVTEFFTSALDADG